MMAPTPYVEPEEHRTGRLVRPFFTHLAEVAATPATAPTTLPAVRQINGARVALVESVTCGICRDGRSVALDKCPWCGCPAGGWMA